MIEGKDAQDLCQECKVRHTSLSPKYILNHRRACVHLVCLQVWLLSQEAPPGEELDMKPKMEEEEVCNNLNLQANKLPYIAIFHTVNQGLN